ncbi:MAG: hypothetical protein ACRBDL_06350 [Alphaproteobacteria bacterium]
MKLKNMIPGFCQEHVDRISKVFDDRADRHAVQEALESFSNSMRYVSETGLTTFLECNGKTPEGECATGAERFYFWSGTQASVHEYDQGEVEKALNGTYAFTALQNRVRRDSDWALKAEPYVDGSGVMTLGFKIKAQSADEFVEGLTKMKEVERERLANPEIL